VIKDIEMMRVGKKEVNSGAEGRGGED